MLCPVLKIIDSNSAPTLIINFIEYTNHLNRAIIDALYTHPPTVVIVFELCSVLCFNVDSKTQFSYVIMFKLFFSFGYCKASYFFASCACHTSSNMNIRPHKPHNHYGHPWSIIFCVIQRVYIWVLLVELYIFAFVCLSGNCEFCFYFPVLFDLLCVWLYATRQKRIGSNCLLLSYHSFIFSSTHLWE